MFKKIHKNMKQTVKLTESKLRGMIQEAVNNTLNENYRILSESYYWYGDTTPLEEIISACNKIYHKYIEYGDKDYEFDPEESTARYDLWKWAQKVCSEAEEFCGYNTSNL